MGLDSYLYRTSKRRVDATKKFREIRRAYSEDIDLLMKKPRWKNLFDSLPKNEFGIVIGNHTLTSRRREYDTCAEPRGVSPRSMDLRLTEIAYPSSTLKTLA